MFQFKIHVSAFMSTLILIVVSPLANLSGQAPSTKEFEKPQFEEVAKQVFQSLKKQQGRIRLSLFEDAQIRLALISSYWADDYLRYFSNESMWEELELTSEQKAGIKRIVDGWEDDIGDLKTSLEGSSAADFGSVNAMHEKEFLEELLPHQRKWLSQIHLKYLLRLNGPFKVIGTKPFRESCNLTRADVQRIKTRSKPIGLEIQESASELRRKTIESLLSVLDEDERQILRDKWPFLTDKYNSSLEQLRIYLIVLQDTEDSMERDHVFEDAELFPDFEIDISGNLVKVEPDFRLKARNLREHCYECFFGYFETDGFDRQLNITVNQTSLLKDLGANMQKALQQSGRLAIEMSGKTRIEQDALKAQGRGIVKSTRLDGYRTLKRILNENQWAQFEEVVNSRLSERKGPFYDICLGELGNQMDYDEDKKNAIRKKWLEILKNLETSVNEIETQAISDFTEQLPEEAKKLFNNLMGKPLKRSPANIEFLTIFFS